MRHYKGDYYYDKNRNQNQNNKKNYQSHSNKFESQDSANYSDGYDSGEVLLAASHTPNENWVLDSGCTFHMTYNEQLLEISGLQGEEM